MEKSVAASRKLHNLVPKNLKPNSRITSIHHQQDFKFKKNNKVKMEASSDANNLIINGGNNSSSSSSNTTTNNNSINNGLRLPLSEVVSDCVKRWFKDTLKEAKAGDINMQILVSQMYYTGYGIPKDAQKGRIWMTRASRTRSSVWKVSEKHPGYNASDSDSDEVRDDAQ